MEARLTPPEGADQLLSDHTDMDRNPRRLGTDDAQGIDISVPEDAYFQYQWRDAQGKALDDPDNPQTAPSVWYGTVNVLTGPAYRPGELADTIVETEPTGELRRERFQSEALGQSRRVNTYTPAGHQNADLPAIVVQDGTAFHRVGRLASALDAVVGQGTQPARLVFLEPVNRDREYRFSDSYENFVLQELIPQLDEVSGPTSDLNLLGASLGGLASATLALKTPEKFKGVAVFSGALLGSPTNPDPYESPDEWVRERVDGGAEIPERWFVGTGTLEWLHGANARFADSLRAAGADVDYVERTAGHNWTAWRDMLGGALRYLLSGR